MNDDRKNATLLPGQLEGELEIWESLGGSPANPEAESPSAATSLGRTKGNLRPTSLEDYIGQARVCENISIACQAAKERGDALDHILLYGPPGLGKTSLARIIADEMGVGFKSSSGPVIERPGDLAAILTSLSEGDLLFIDEIHRLPRVVEEVLYPAMEDFQIDILIGQGSSARSVRLDLKPFTLIGATTRSGMLTSPLRDRFGMVQRLSYYTSEELRQIIERSASIMDFSIEPDAALELARRSRGTPRIANRILKRLRDYVAFRKAEQATRTLAEECLAKLDIDSHGLEQMDRLLLETIIDTFHGGPVGIDSLAAAIGEERSTLEDVYEPYLIQQGFLIRTRRGRTIGAAALKHLGRDPSSIRQGVLFSDEADTPRNSESCNEALEPGEGGSA